MKKIILTAIAIVATSQVYATCNSYNSNCQQYQSNTGTLYQYDMSNPSDRLNYSIDIDAQKRDTRSININQDLDRGLGQYGGGIYE